MNVGRGDRTDLWEVKDMLDHGATMLEVAEAHFPLFVRCNKGLNAYRSLAAAHEGRRMPAIHVLMGPTGCGKSKWVAENYPNAFWFNESNSVWWDGYANEETIIFDEFGRGSYPYKRLLRLLDPNPVLVEVKGTFVPFSATKFVFTTNTGVKQWYDRDTAALERRFRESAEVWTVRQPDGGIPSVTVTKPMGHGEHLVQMPGKPGHM